MILGTGQGHRSRITAPSGSRMGVLGCLKGTRRNTDPVLAHRDQLSSAPCRPGARSGLRKADRARLPRVLTSSALHRTKGACGAGSSSGMTTMSAPHPVTRSRRTAQDGSRAGVHGLARGTRRKEGDGLRTTARCAGSTPWMCVPTDCGHLRRGLRSGRRMKTNSDGLPAKCVCGARFNSVMNDRPGTAPGLSFRVSHRVDSE